MNLLAVIAGTAASLIWIALVGIAVAAIILYWPRRFSGPLTEHERRLAAHALGGRSLAWTLATPLLTVLGFVLLLPPSVHLHVGIESPGSESPCQPAESWWSAMASKESTESWVDAVLCRAEDEPLAQAIVAAAGDGFRRPADCSIRDVSGTERASVELSVVELAARAYHLTGVVLDPGPRLMDPDPWDIMKRTLDARGVPTCRHADVEAPGSERGKILRLGHATLDPGAELRVAAVVWGNVCSGVPAKLLTWSGELIRECRLTHATPACDGSGQRVLQMDGICGDLMGGALLSADFGRTRIHRQAKVELRFDPPEQSMTGLFEELRNDRAFREDLQRRGLQLPKHCRGCEQASVVRLSGRDVVIEKSNAGAAGGTSADELVLAEPRQGPFSWAGVANVPTISCTDERVVINDVAEIIAPQRPSDPTAMYALMSSIVWAANVLAVSTCAEAREIPVGLVGGQPLLTAEQIDEAVAAMRRPRDTLGLVCLALALVALALSLRRSVR